MAVELRPVEPFDIYSEPTSVATRWEAYKDRLEIYLAATGIRHQAQKKALLLHNAGKDVQDLVHNHLVLPQHASSDDILAALDDHFRSKLNIPFERYEFRMLRRVNTET